MEKVDDQYCFICFMVGQCGVRSVYLDTDGLSTNFTSPGFPSFYYSKLDCHWQIFAEPEMVVSLNILQFNLERNFDFLIFGNGINFNENKTGRLTGPVKVKYITSSGPVLWMIMKTDLTGSAEGFVFEMSQVSSTEAHGT